MACFDILRLFVGIVIEVALNIDDRGTLVAGAAGQVAQGADKIRQVPGVVPSDTMLPTRLTEASFSRIFCATACCSASPDRSPKS